MEALDPKDLQPPTMLGMKLIQQPFSKTPVADRLFDFDSLKQTRDTVSHHLQFSHLLMVIQGKQGGGKNSFANSLIVSEHPALYFFNATADSGNAIRELLNKAAQNNNASDIKVLEQRFHDIMYRGQQPVLIINDAHLLDPTILQQLIAYASGIKDDNQQTQLKLLLLGDLGLEKKLETNGVLNHNQFYIIELPQLNVSNTRAFLEHRLQQAGYRDASPFSDQDISNIFNMANGNPDATLKYAAEALNNNKSLYEEDFGSPNKTRKNLIIIGATLFAAAFIYNSLLSTDDADTISPASTTETIPLPGQNNILDANKPLNQTANSAVDQLFKPGSKASNTMDVKQPSAKTEATESLAPSMPFSSPSNKSDAGSTLKTAELIKPSIKSADQPTENNNSTPAPTASGVPLPTSTEETTTPAVTEPAVNKTVSQVSPKPTTATKPTATKSTPAATSAVDKTTQSFINAGVHSPQWLLQQPAGNWGLQILGAHKPETLLAFVHQHKLGNKVAYYRTRLGNNDWHVILYGSYPSKDKAKAVIPYLPSYIRENNPWPKDMKSVQNAIKQLKNR